MADYLEVVQFKQRDGKWRPNRLGYAKKNDKGGLNVYFDVMPIPDHEGSVRFTIQKPQDRSEGQGGSQQTGQTPSDLDDEVPF